MLVNKINGSAAGLIHAENYSLLFSFAFPLVPLTYMRGDFPCIYLSLMLEQQENWITIPQFEVPLASFLNKINLLLVDKEMHQGATQSSEAAENLMKKSIAFPLFAFSQNGSVFVGDAAMK